MPEKMTDEQLRALADAEFDQSMGAPGGEIGLERAQAWQYYLGKLFGDEVEGQSQVVTSDVADVVDGIMPSLLRIFTTADNLVEFDPVGAEDEAGARQESDYVNHVFFKQNPAFLILYTWFFDALVQKNGIVKAWWDDSERIATESYRGLTDEELAELIDNDELEPIEQDEREETVTQQVQTEMGPVEQSVTVTVHDVTFRRTSKRGRPRVEPVPPEEFRISSDARSLDPSGARMVGHEREISRSELIEMGFDKSVVEELPESGVAPVTTEETARHDKSDEQVETPSDKSQQKVKVREIYMRVDFDGDGRSEMRQIFTAEGRLLSNEAFDRQPFHVISPQPLPHKHFGRATAEKVMDVQRVNSTLVRQILDNLYHTNNPGHAVWEQGIGENTLDDLLTTRAGSIKRFRRPVGESWAPMTVPFTAAATFPMLEYWDKTKRDRTGVSSDSQGLSPEALKNIQTSVLAQAVDVSRMKIEAIARVFAETGIKSLFRHIHELLLKHSDKHKTEIVKLRNAWTEVKPWEWRARHNMTVKIGLGIGTREQNLLHLNAIWEKQMEMVNAGGLGLTVTPRGIFNTAAEIVKNANLQAPEMFFTDPGDRQAPPGNDQQQQLAQMQAQLAARQQQLEAANLQLDREKAALQHQRDMMELERKREADQAKLAVEMEKIANALTKLELDSGRNVPGSRV